MDDFSCQTLVHDLFGASLAKTFNCVDEISKRDHVCLRIYWLSVLGTYAEAQWLKDY